jgi:hypothetical protein
LEELDSWVGRTIVIAIGGGYAIQAAALFVFTARDAGGLTHALVGTLAMRAHFGSLLLAAALAQSMTLGWIAAAVFVAPLLVRAYEALFGPASLE